MNIKAIKIKDVALSEETQQRASIDLDLVSEYSESIKCGDKFPPITVFFDSAQYWIADGHHRYHAYKDIGNADIDADIHDGTKDDAIMFSFGVNGSHGKRLTNADKYKNVKKALSFHRTKDMSEREIARICQVTHPFVSKIKKEISNKSVVTVTTSPIKPKPALVAGKTEDEKYDQKEHELQEANDTIKDLSEENTKLRDAIASGQLPDVEIIPTEQIMVELRKQIKTLEVELDAVKLSRDTYQRENAELKNQCEMQARQLKKLGGWNAKS